MGKGRPENTRRREVCTGRLSALRVTRTSDSDGMAGRAGKTRISDSDSHLKSEEETWIRTRIVERGEREEDPYE